MDSKREEVAVTIRHLELSTSEVTPAEVTTTAASVQQPGRPQRLGLTPSDGLPEHKALEYESDHSMHEVCKGHESTATGTEDEQEVVKEGYWLLRRWNQFLAGQKAEFRYWLLTVLLLGTTLASWMAVLYFLKGKASAPDGDIFSIICVWLAALIMGEAVSKLVHPLLGAILAGFLLRSVPGVEPHLNISGNTSSNVRNSALVVVLLRAGLTLDLPTLSRSPVLCMLMCIFPLVAEAVGVAVVATSLLEFPWKWAFMAGFLISAVSPAVVVPILIPMAKAGYGVEKGIPSLVFTVAAVSSVLSITTFYVWDTIIFRKPQFHDTHAHALCNPSSSTSSPDDTTLLGSVFRAPQELLMGLVSGLLLGVAACLVSPKMEEEEAMVEYEQVVKKDTKKITRQAYKRLALLLGLGLFGLFGYRRLSFNGAGAMTMFTMGTVVAVKWGRRRSAQVQDLLANIWIYIAQPLLFGIIGSSLDYRLFKPGFLWKALLVLFSGTVFRLVTTVVASLIGDLNLKERIFLAFAWIPKATVQAALATVALRDVLSISTDDPRYATYEEYGQQVLALAILCVLVDAPIGAILVALGGPRLLTKAPQPTEELPTAENMSNKE